MSVEKFEKFLNELVHHSRHRTRDCSISIYFGLDVSDSSISEDWKCDLSDLGCVRISVDEYGWPNIEMDWWKHPARYKGADYYLEKGISEEKHFYKRGLFHDLSLNKKHLSFFIGEVGKSRFMGLRSQDIASEWQAEAMVYLARLSSIFEKLLKRDAARFSKTRPLYNNRGGGVIAAKEFKREVSAWDAAAGARYSSCRDKVFSQIVKSAICTLLKLAHVFGQSREFSVTTYPGEVDEYISATVRRINHHARHEPSQKRLEADLLQQWPSITARLKPHFRCVDGEFRARQKSIQRAIKRGHRITHGTRVFFKLTAAAAAVGKMMKTKPQTNKIAA